MKRLRALGRHRHAEGLLTCPTCHKKLNYSASLNPNAEGPRDGDITVCVRCGDALTYEHGVTSLRALSNAEIEALTADVLSQLEETRSAIDVQQLICQRALEMRVVVPGTSFDRKCAKCGHHVGIALSGQRVLAERADTIIICNRCFHPIPGEEYVAAPGAIEEAKRTLGED